MKRFYAFFPAVMLAFGLWAVPAAPYPIIRVQPDGMEITIYLHGDEWAHCQATSEGLVVQQDADGMFCYLHKDGRLSAQRVGTTQTRSIQVQGDFLTVAEWGARQTANANMGSQRVQQSPSRRLGGFPLKDSPRALVILVNFADQAFITPNPQKAFSDMLSKSGYDHNGATGSALDYFRSCSQGQFAPQFDVIGPYTLPGNIEFYGANESNGNDSNPAQMIVDACAAADEDGVDFTIYDTDDDGQVDNIFVYYAGHNEAEGAASSTIWPHRSVVVEGERGNVAEGAATFDGKKVYDYACTSELKGNEGETMAAIGTFCHEFGHVLGLPDYYNITDARAVTLGMWDIMCSGSYANESRTPPLYSAYDRFYLGWLTPQEIDSPDYMYLLPLTQADTQVDMSNQAFLVAAEKHDLDGQNPNPSEFFIAEYRTKTGWDTYLPEEGILFWHIDYSKWIWNMNMPNTVDGRWVRHMCVYLEAPRKGTYTTPVDYSMTPYGAYSTGSFVPVQWDETELGKPFTDIRLGDDTAFFTFMGGDPIVAPQLLSPEDVYTTGFTARWTAVWQHTSETQGYYITVSDTQGNIVIDEQWVMDTIYDVKGLEPGTEYTYSVKAAYLAGDNVVKQASEPDTVTTLQDTDPEHLNIKYNPEENTLYVIKNDPSKPLYIYDMSGRLVYTDKTDAGLVRIDVSSFSTGTAYILNADERSAKWVK